MDSRTDYDQSSQYLTNLSIIDEEFVDKVQHDIERFVLRRPNQSVLLFPPVNNYRRFLIHQTCESLSQRYDICTFSVGQGFNRRTVVTFKNQLLQTHKFNEETIECKKGTNLKNNLRTVKNMGVKRQTSDVRRKLKENLSEIIKQLNYKISTNLNMNITKPAPLNFAIFTNN